MRSSSTLITSGCVEPMATCVKILILMAGSGSIAMKDSRCPTVLSMSISTAGTAGIQSETTGSLAISVSVAGLDKAATRSYIRSKR